MDGFVQYTKKAKRVGSYDTVVCGAGPAGWVAAVAAAREGNRTALIERFGFIGGTASGGLVIPLSGGFYKGERVVGGIAWEFVERLVKAGAAQVELPKGHVSFDPEYYKVEALRMVREAGVEVYTNSYVSDCICEDTAQGRTIKTVIIESKNGSEAIDGKVFIDATGDGDLCYMSGVPMLEGSEDGLQPMSMCFLLGGVDLTTDLLKNSIHHDGKVCKQSVNTVIANHLNALSKTEDVPQFGGPWFNTIMCGDLVAVNITRAAADATDRESMFAAEEKMRQDAYRFIEILKRDFPEFKNAYIPLTAIQAGVRETRHIKGVHVLTGAEILEGKEQRDSVALCAHPMDIHVSGDNSQILKHLNCAGKIPYGSLISNTHKNLYAIGRCMSADRYAYATVRVQATVMAMGEAAGVASSMVCRDGVSVNQLDTDRLRKRLTELGAKL